MKRTIEVLRLIRQTHRLLTVVQLGSTCASACIPIFLQGEQRYAARASLWGFHQSSWEGPDRIQGDALINHSDLDETEKKLRAYYEPAGVSKWWLNKLRFRIVLGDWWQTGGDLWEGKSGIITQVLSDTHPRLMEERRDFSPAVICGAFCRG